MTLGVRLFASESDHGIQRRRATAGEVAGQHCDYQDRKDGEDESVRVARRNAKEVAGDETRGYEGYGDADDGAPQLASVSESLRIIQVTVPLWAPKAIRIPISPVRAFTAYAITP